MPERYCGCKELFSVTCNGTEQRSCCAALAFWFSMCSLVSAQATRFPRGGGLGRCAGQRATLGILHGGASAWALLRPPSPVWHIVALSRQVHGSISINNSQRLNFPLCVFIVLYEGVMRRKAPCLSTRLKSCHVSSAAKAALPAPLYCSDCCTERNRRAQALLASASPGIPAGIYTMFFLSAAGQIQHLFPRHWQQVEKAVQAHLGHVRWCQDISIKTQRRCYL